MSLVIASVFLYTLNPPPKQAEFTRLTDDAESDKSGLVDSDGEDGDIEDEGDLPELQTKKNGDVKTGQIV